MSWKTFNASHLPDLANSLGTRTRRLIGSTNKDIFFWLIKDFPFPSLWFAVAKDRPVTYEDTRNVTWGWKDEALGKRIWYYGKLLRRKSTLV